ncbi:MAG TPA: hypothetical protein VKH37_06555 [Ferruginibacter sp.]|nr:hypothetical protein [Ferruginibacter sp.]
MQQDNSPHLLDNDAYEKKKLPSGINVLTILTFIGCGLNFLTTVGLPWLNKVFLGFMDDAMKKKDLSEKKLADLTRKKEMIVLVQDNLPAVMAITFAGLALCFVGALWMRKLKKDGFWLYVAGEIAPLIAIPLVLGSYRNDMVETVINLVVPVTFVILYATQRKHLVN